MWCLIQWKSYLNNGLNGGGKMSFMCEDCGKEKYTSMHVLTDDGKHICRACDERLEKIVKGIQEDDGDPPPQPTDEVSKR